MIEHLVRELIDAGRRLGESSLNAGTAGNLSARSEDGRLIITRRRTRKASLTVLRFPNTSRPSIGCMWPPIARVWESWR